MTYLRKNWRRLAAFALIAIGLFVTVRYAMRAVRSFQELRYIDEVGLNDGTADVSAIEPWMTARFVAVAYGVPEEYLFDWLGIRYDERDANAPLGMINRRFRLGRDPIGEDPEILEEIRQAIRAYQADPVTVELGRVEPWMSLRYIANSTGVPVDDLRNALGLPAGDARLLNMPLRELEEEPGVSIPRGRELMRVVQDALRAAGVGE